MPPQTSITAKTREEYEIDRLHYLIRSIRDYAHFDHPVIAFELVETHISCILLTGPYAYKFKKPVNPGFLDFSTLEKRKFYCEEELRLNRRLAPDLYLGMIAITGTYEQPVLDGDGPAIEYAVKMVQFSGNSEFDQMVAKGVLSSGHIEQLARQLSSFHSCATADIHSELGSPEGIRKQVFANLDQLQPLIQNDRESCDKIIQLEKWTRQAYDTLTSIFQARKEQGYVRECHGDLHLGNVAMLGTKPVIFDCIEFSDEYRFIDIMSEIAFLCMDLDAHGHPEHAWRLLNACLQDNADYAGLQVLGFYQVYRALVRSKVICLRLRQSGLVESEVSRETGRYRRYLDLACSYIRPAATSIIITHGLSGSGKTTLSQLLLENPGAIRIRSDIERKRLHGLAVDEKTHSALNTGIYSGASSEQTYDRLLELARLILDAGYPVIVDATFLCRTHRLMFHNLAQQRGIPFIIVDCQAEEKQLRDRVEKRLREDQDVSEASLVVLDAQIATCEKLDATETPYRIIMDMSVPLDQQARTRAIRKVREFHYHK